MKLPLAYGELEGEWLPENEVTVNVEKPAEEPKEIFAYNTELYKLIENNKGVKDNITSSMTMEESNTDNDDWTKYPACKKPTKYQLVGYFGMTGKDKFREMKPATKEEEVFSIVSSDDVEESFLFEEDIQNLETESYSVTKEVKTVDQDPSKEDFKRLNSDSIAISRTLKDLNALQEYIKNEGNLPDAKSKCQECLKKNC